jgi:rhodanese-related sulfurtransferase
MTPLRALLLAAALLALPAAAAAVAPPELARQLATDAPPVVLDVRTEAEHRSGHVPGAVHIPLQELEGRVAELAPERPIVVYCESGGRATRAARLLTQRGFKNVQELDGSMSAWRAAGLPVAK